jgi:ribosome maturation factor RimP
MSATTVGLSVDWRKLVTSTPIDGQSAFAGRLAGVEDGVVLVAEGRRTHRVPLGVIKRARLEVEF